MQTIDVLDGKEKRIACIFITNAGVRPFRVTAITFEHGLIRKTSNLLVVKRETAFCPMLGQTLKDGDGTQYGFEIGTGAWIDTLPPTLKRPHDLKTFRVVLHLSNGQKVTVKPDPAMIDHMRKGMQRNASESP